MGVKALLSLFENDFIKVDYANIVEEQFSDILHKGYSIGFTNDQLIIYVTSEFDGIQMIFLDKDGKSFSKYMYTERLVKNLYKVYKFNAIVGFKIKENILNMPLEADRMYLINKALIDIRCTLCDDTPSKNIRSKA